MSIDTHPTVQSEDVTPPPQKPGPVVRIIAGSLAAGLVAAMVLTLGVFAGGAESVIIGSTLVAFGLGWTLIAALTVRWTSQPQRWAAIPAVVMSASGLALLAVTPDNAAMTQLSRVWPPIVLILAVWMFVQMRRALTGRGRWLLTPVVVVLALAAVGGTYENVALAHDRATYAAPGTIYEVDGHKLHLDCRGQGGPTVVLNSGLGEISASWAMVADQIAETTRVCAYDRAGQGWSTDAETPQDGVTAAKDLNTLLAVAGETGPFVLVGHSTGGTYAMNYAAQYPEQVAGLVLLDSSSPEQLTIIPSFAGQYAMMRRGLALLPTLARLGMPRALGVLGSSDLPASAADRVQALTVTAHAARNGRDEVSTIPAVFEQAQELTTLRGRPLVVLTASETLKTAGWVGAQDKLAALSTNHIHRNVSSTHEGLVDDERASTDSVRAITDVITAVRTGTPLDPK